MKLLIVLSLLLLSSATYAKSAYIDEELKAYDEQRKSEMRKVFKECKSSQNSLICEDEKFEALDEKLPSRGTDKYYEKKYSKLSKTKADQVLKKLSKVVSQARWATSRHKDGEISLNLIEREGHWIQANIMGRTRTMQEPLQLSTGEILPFYSQTK